MSDERSQEGQADRRRQPVANGSSESLSETFTIYCCVSCGTTGDKGGACPACGDQCDPVRVVAAEESEARIEQLEEAQERAAEFLGRVNLDGIAGVEGWDDDKIDEAKRLIGIARSALRGASLTTAPPSEGVS